MQMLEEILKIFCQLRILNYELIDDLWSQLQIITTNKGDEEKSLLLIVRIAKKELKKWKKESSQTAKNKGLRIVLLNVICEAISQTDIHTPPNTFNPRSMSSVSLIQKI